jgi:hypothetical protein
MAHVVTLKKSRMVISTEVFNEVVFVDDLNLPQRLRAEPEHALSG